MRLICSMVSTWKPSARNLAMHVGAMVSCARWGDGFMRLNQYRQTTPGQRRERRRPWFVCGRLELVRAVAAPKVISSSLRGADSLGTLGRYAPPREQLHEVAGEGSLQQFLGNERAGPDAAESSTARAELLSQSRYAALSCSTEVLASCERSACANAAAVAKASKATDFWMCRVFIRAPGSVCTENLRNPWRFCGARESLEGFTQRAAAPAG
jgi:hypothetical protein